MRKFKRAAVLGATLLAISGGAVGVAQAEQKPSVQQQQEQEQKLRAQLERMEQAQKLQEQHLVKGHDRVYPGDFGDCMEYRKNLMTLGLVADAACMGNGNGTFTITPYYAG